MDTIMCGFFSKTQCFSKYLQDNTKMYVTEFYQELDVIMIFPILMFGLYNICFKYLKSLL